MTATGGHVYLYSRGFFHSKSIVVDDVACAVGTMNMDIRSLKLQKELMVWNYDATVVGRLTEIFFQDLEGSREVTREEIGDWGWWRGFRNSVARLASNVI